MRNQTDGETEAWKGISLLFQCRNSMTELLLQAFLARGGKVGLTIISLSLVPPLSPNLATPFLDLPCYPSSVHGCLAWKRIPSPSSLALHPGPSCSSWFLHPTPQVLLEKRAQVDWFTACSWADPDFDSLLLSCHWLSPSFPPLPTP